MMRRRFISSPPVARRYASRASTCIFCAVRLSDGRVDLTAAEALATSAVQLFMDRAFASGHASRLTDIDAPAVAAICSRLDGIALAIEMAGSRSAPMGFKGPPTC